MSYLISSHLFVSPVVVLYEYSSLPLFILLSLYLLTSFVLSVCSLYYLGRFVQFSLFLI